MSSDVEVIERPSIQRSFRIQAKSFFLTYPQCTQTKQALKQFLDTKGRVVYYLIGQETHEDGGQHLHALVTYDKKINVRSQNFFDFNGAHPNVQAAKNIPALKNYISKEDEAPLTSEQATEDNLYDLARVTPEEEFFEICRKRKVHPSIDYRFPICMPIRHSTRYREMQAPTRYQTRIRYLGRLPQSRL